MNDRLSELLPWYVNDTLDPADRAWVEAELARNPARASEAQWLQSLQSRIRENQPPVAATIGLDRAMARIRAERVRSPGRAARPTALMRVSQWFAGFGMRPALGAAAAIIVVQGLLMVSMYRTNDELTNQIRAARPTVAPRVEYLRVTFKPDAKEEEIRLAISEVKGWLVDGPGTMGDYFLRVPGATKDAEAALKRNPVVADVAKVDRLPTRD